MPWKRAHRARRLELADPRRHLVRARGVVARHLPDVVRRRCRDHRAHRASGYDVAWQWQLIWFCGLSLAAVLLAAKYLRKHPLESERPLLNERAVQLIGQVLRSDRPDRQRPRQHQDRRHDLAGGRSGIAARARGSKWSVPTARCSRSRRPAGCLAARLRRAVEVGASGWLSIAFSIDVGDFASGPFDRRLGGSCVAWPMGHMA